MGIGSKEEIKLPCLYKTKTYFLGGRGDLNTETRDQYKND